MTINCILSTLTRRILLSMTLIAILSIYSCKKDSNPGASKTNSLTSGTWKLQKIEFHSSNDTWAIDPLDPDDPTDGNTVAYTFLANGTYTELDSGKTKVGTWILSADKTQLTLTTLDGGTTFSYTYTVTVLTSSTLQIVAPGADRETYGH